MTLESAALVGVGLCGLIVVYVYGIFPALMGAFASRSRASDLSAKNPCIPSVSLVIPAYNEEMVIGEKVANALSIDYPAEKLEIIVACDGGTDRTAEIAREHADDRIRVEEFEERRGKASVLNDAVNLANGSVLVLCDANVMFAKDAVWRLVSYFEDEQVGAVSGDVQLRSKDASFGKGESLYYKMEVNRFTTKWKGRFTAVNLILAR